MPHRIVDQYPVTHHLEDGAQVTCSLMSHADREALSKFLGRLTRSDLAYLQIDITQSEIQERWFDTIAEGKSVCLCAYDPAGLVGYASVQVSGDAAGMGEIRINISRGYRSRGLGRILTTEICGIAKQLELSSLTARMLTNQHGARAAFRKLGFVDKQVMEAYVKDPSAECRDLLVMISNLQS